MHPSSRLSSATRIVFRDIGDDDHADDVLAEAVNGPGTVGVGVAGAVDVVVGEVMVASNLDVPLFETEMA